MPPNPKTALLAAIVAQLEEELAQFTAGAETSRQEATDAENRQEGKYDMRAQLAAYLAAGQAKLAAELHEALTAYRHLSVADLPPGSAVTVGALVSIETNRKPSWFFLGPARGGLEIPIGDDTVTIITPTSPLGRQILGRKAGEPLPPSRRLLSVM
ncbi:MAG TPA: transcription elongation factor [Opitutaceae bacterium]|jgi:transcription elongation GreA/GreB family factor